jgi:hypothetical protein
LKVLVACEFSGVVREAFRAKGHDAWSADLLPTTSEHATYHLQGDIFTEEGRFVWEYLPWDLIIAHPPCTHLAGSGARWFATRQVEQRKAIWFFMACTDLPAAKIAVENPIGIMSRLYRKPDQIVQPWQFGHGETKATCLWLKGLPKLQPTNIVEGRVARVHRESPGPDRWKRRSITYQGLADAMAEQWGAC